MNRQQFAARVWSKLLAFSRARRLLVRGDRALVAVSGGPDSVCLAHFLRELSRRDGFELRLAHVHHGLRGASADRDARFVRELGAALGLPTVVLRVPTRRAAALRRQGMEEAARKLRYAALLAEARRSRCNKVATAHQLDDQAETVLLHLLRGTRLDGLAGMPVRRPLGPRVELVRPLLALRRAEVRAYLARHDLDSRTDPSNRSLRFTRNWVRLRLLPLLETRNPRIREHLAALAEQASRLPR